MSGNRPEADTGVADFMGFDPSCEFTDMKRHFWDRSPFINQSTFNPEYIYGVC